MADVFYFGCWNQAGHFLHGPPERRPDYESERSIVHYGDKLHIDGTLAPRLADQFRNGLPTRRVVTWGGSLPTGRERSIDKGNSVECLQGQFLRHQLDNGFTAIQWWDRCQGDARPNCNSTILMRGEHSSAELLAAGREHFPRVFENLKKHGVELREIVKLGTLRVGALFVFASGYIDGAWRVGEPDKPGDNAPRCYPVGAESTGKPFVPDCWVIEVNGNG